MPLKRVLLDSEGSDDDGAVGPTGPLRDSFVDPAKQRPHQNRENVNNALSRIKNKRAKQAEKLAAAAAAPTSSVAVGANSTAALPSPATLPSPVAVAAKTPLGPAKTARVGFINSQSSASPTPCLAFRWTFQSRLMVPRPIPNFSWRPGSRVH